MLDLSIPYSRQRRYLTGIDWSIGVLDYVSRQATGVGNLSQVILEVEGALDDIALCAALAQVSRRLPVIHGRVARDALNLVPYWRIPKAASSPVRVKAVDLPDGAAAAADALFARHVNAPLRDENEHLRFLAVRLGRRRSRLGMAFDHRLLDAFGAEAFLELIEQTSQGRLEEIAGRIRQTEPAHLDRWARRFASGKVVNRFRLRLPAEGAGGPRAGLPQVAAASRRCRAGTAPPLLRTVDSCEPSAIGAGSRAAGAGSPAPRHGRIVRFLHAALTPEQTAAFLRRAEEECGVPILLPAAISRAACAVAPDAGPSPRGRDVIVASTDMRGAGQKWETLFFNHLSFLGFSVPTEERDATRLTPLLRDQFVEQMRLDLPAALQDAAMLMRICPRAAAARIARLAFGGVGRSLYFACLRESAFEAPSFLGLKAVDLVHTPRVPPVPGRGVCLTFFAGRLHMVLSYLDGVLDDGSAAAAIARLKASMEA